MPALRRLPRRRRAAQALTVIVVGATVAACGSGGTAGAPADNTLRVGMSSDPGPLDPVRTAIFSAVKVYRTMCQSLYDVQDDGKVVPLLAASEPVVSDDGLTIRVALRDDVVFADGTKMDAAAVVTSIERYRDDPESQQSHLVRDFKTITPVDPTTVEITSESPITASAFSVAMLNAGMIMSPTALEQTGPEGFGAAPVCAGPFKFESAVANDEVVLVKDPNYFDADAVKVDRLVFKIINDASIRLANLRSGDLHVIEDVEPSSLGQIEGSGDLQVLQAPTLGFHYLLFNLDSDSPVAQDPRIRRALDLSIDREQLNTVAFSGTADVVCAYFPQDAGLGSDAANPPCPTRDLDAARRLLQEAGVQTPVRARLLTTNSPAFGRLAESIAAMAAEAGFELEIDQTETTTSVARLEEGDFDVNLAWWSGRSDPDPTFARFWLTGSSTNYARLSDPEIDRLIEQGRAEQDPAVRAEIYGRATELINEVVAQPALMRASYLGAASSGVEGVVLAPDGMFRFTTAGFK